jgi:hypothetical protein
MVIEFAKKIKSKHTDSIDLLNVYLWKTLFSVRSLPAGSVKVSE